VERARSWLPRRLARRPPRAAALAALCLVLLAGAGYGIAHGDRVAALAAAVREGRDMLANAAGFAIRAVVIEGNRNLSAAEILASGGITERTSLLFVDALAVRARLKANPWIAEATVRKFYPGRLEITVVEREPFALWQKDGKISVVAADGTRLAPFGDRRYATLPLVVGAGAETRAKDFLATLARYPALNEQVRAAILVAERRWNLKLKNGIDVRLPEVGLERALDTLVTLDRSKKLLSRDITAVDLRLADRVTVRLSEEAAKAREEALKAKNARKKGGDA
jgi:cell division protein FtsQ